MDDDDEVPKKEPNPFSFKAFVKKKEVGDPHEDDIFAVVSKSSSSRSHSGRSSATGSMTGIEAGDTPFPEVETEGNFFLGHFHTWGGKLCVGVVKELSTFSAAYCSVLFCVCPAFICTYCT